MHAITRIFDYFRPGTSHPVALSRPANLAAGGSHYIPVYPPTDPGIPFTSVDDIVASQSELIDRIMKAASLSPESPLHIRQLIRNFAEYVHLLPATRSEQYPGDGGLFRMGLEVGFYSLRASHGVIFASEIAEVRVKTIPCWRIATFVAGLLSDTYRAVTAMRVIGEDGTQWNPFAEPLTTFLIRTKCPRYYIKWAKNAKETPAYNNLVVGTVVPPLLLAYLSSTEPKIIGSMLEAIAGTGTSPLSQAVKTTRNGLILRDVQSNPNLVGRPMMGSHLEANIIDAMRSLVRERKWDANEKGQPLWNGPDGLFLIIQTGWKDLYAAMQENGFQGIPTDFTTIAEILLKAGVIESSAKGGHVYGVMIPNTGKRAKEAVKLISGIKAFGDAYQGFSKLPDPLLPAPAEDDGEVATGNQDILEPDARAATSPSDADMTEDDEMQNSFDECFGDNAEKDDAAVPNEEGPSQIKAINEVVWTRYASDWHPEAAQWFRTVIAGIASNSIEFKEYPDACGLKASMIDNAGLSRGSIVSIMTRDIMIWSPAEQKKKFVDVDGEPYLFFNRRFLDEVLK